MIFTTLPNKLLGSRYTVAFVATVVLFASFNSLQAATIVSSTFTSVGLTSDQDIDLTGPNVVDWGYFEQRQNFFADNDVDNDKAVSGFGTVTVTPGSVTNATANSIANHAKFTMTFDDGVSPSSGTVEIGAGLGAWAGTEDNAATFNFEDLGQGTHTVRLYVGHSNNTRVFDMDYSVTATDGNLSGNTVSNAISSGDVHSTYELVFSTLDENADLTLQFNSTSGGSGSGWIGGYVVETVAIPEPTTLALLIPGCLLGILRHRAS